MKISLGQRTVMLGTVTTLVVGAIALAVLGAGGLVAWEYSNSNAFCTNNCYAVHPEEPRAYAVYSHARVQCIECHMGRLPTLQLMTLKAAHYHELLGMITGYKRRRLIITARQPPKSDAPEGSNPAFTWDSKWDNQLALTCPDNVTSSTISDTMRLRYIQETAYYLAQRRGFVGGCAWEDWLEAEKQVDAMLAKNADASVSDNMHTE